MDFMGILIAFVLPITILGMIFTHKQKMMDVKLKQNQSPERVKSLEAELAAVKERLNTLEAIVTDNKYQLNKEFSQLKSVNE